MVSWGSCRDTTEANHKLLEIDSRIKTHSIFKKKSSPIDKTEINQDLKTM